MYEKYTQLRDERGILDATVAKETGLHPCVFSNWKSGKSKPKADKLLKIAKLFDVPVEYFLEETT